MKNHALSHHHHHVVVRHRRPDAVAVRWFAFCRDRFLMLPIGAAIALVWCNAAPESYFKFAHTFRFLINDVGMAFFFGLIAQEVLEAVMPHGALHSWRRWGLALVAAAGGIVGAGLWYTVYVQLVHQEALLVAWPVACAVDAAIAYYLFKTVCPRSALLPFVLVVGIATNLFSVVAVGFRGSVVDANAIGVFLILVAIGCATLLRAWKVPTFWPYLAIVGTISWWALYSIGVYPALAFLPVVPFLPHEPRKLDLFAAPPDDDATHHFEHEWTDLVQWILFCFGLVNAGVVLGGLDVGTWALLTAALIGRPVGMLVAIRLAIAAGLHLPARVGWKQLVVAALATSCGFTFALAYAIELLGIGSVREQITMGALATIGGVVVTLVVARWLKVGRYALRPPASHPSEGRAVGS